MRVYDLFKHELCFSLRENTASWINNLLLFHYFPPKGNSGNALFDQGRMIEFSHRQTIECVVCCSLIIHIFECICLANMYIMKYVMWENVTCNSELKSYLLTHLCISSDVMDVSLND